MMWPWKSRNKYAIESEEDDEKAGTDDVVRRYFELRRLQLELAWKAEETKKKALPYIGACGREYRCKE